MVSEDESLRPCSSVSSSTCSVATSRSRVKCYSKAHLTKTEVSNAPKCINDGFNQFWEWAGINSNGKPTYRCKKCKSKLPQFSIVFSLKFFYLGLSSTDFNSLVSNPMRHTKTQHRVEYDAYASKAKQKESRQPTIASNITLNFNDGKY